MISYIVPLVAIVGIVGLVAFALSQGIDGAVMSTGIALVAGIAGYRVKASQDKRKGG